MGEAKRRAAYKAKMNAAKLDTLTREQDKAAIRSEAARKAAATRKANRAQHD